MELGRYDALFCHKLLHFNSANVCYVCDLYFAGGADELRLHVATHHRDIAGLHPKVSHAHQPNISQAAFTTVSGKFKQEAKLSLG